MPSALPAQSDNQSSILAYGESSNVLQGDNVIFLLKEESHRCHGIDSVERWAGVKKCLAFISTLQLDESFKCN